jgi:outer membrane protein OmpA-like peptidoglycan-associated protein
MNLNYKYYLLFLFIINGTNALAQKSSFPTVWEKVEEFPRIDITEIKYLNNNIYIGSSKGLYRLTKDTLEKKYPQNKDLGIYSLTLGNSKCFLAITYENKVVSIPLLNDSCKYLNFDYWFKTTNLPFFENIICSSNSFWLLTKNKGLFEGNLNTFAPNPNNSYLNFKYPKTTKWVTSICKNGDQKWIGSQDGLLVVDQFNNQLHKNKFKKSIEKILTYKKDTMFCLYLDQGEYYLGKISCQKNKIIEHTSTKIKFSNNNLKILTINDAIVDNSGLLWIVSKEIIAYFNPISLSWSTFSKNNTYTGLCTSICFDENNNLWLGTYEQGLFKVSYPLKDSIKVQQSSNKEISYEKVFELFIEFEQDSCSINTIYKDELNQIAQKIKTIDIQDTIIVTGHTSRAIVDGISQIRGNKWSLNLSKCRAKSVKSFFIEQAKIKNPNRIICIGKGDLSPKYKGVGKSLDKKNRRVEISFKQKENHTYDE